MTAVATRPKVDVVTDWTLPLTREGHRLLTKLTGVASTDGARSVLATVAFDNEYVVATDSYCLVRVPYKWMSREITEQPPFPSKLGPVAISATLLKRALGPANDKAVITLTEEGCTVESDGLTSTISATDGTYPAYQKLLDIKPNNDRAAAFNPRILARMFSVFPQQVPALVLSGNDKPARLFLDDTLVGIVMPLRPGGTTSTWEELEQSKPARKSSRGRRAA